MLPSLFTCKLLIKSVHIWEEPSLWWWPLANLIESLILPQGQALNVMVAVPTTCFHVGKLGIVAFISSFLHLMSFHNGVYLVAGCLVVTSCCPLLHFPANSRLRILSPTGRGRWLILYMKHTELLFNNMCILWEEF